MAIILFLHSYKQRVCMNFCDKRERTKKQEKVLIL